MKKYSLIFIILGILCLIGIVILSALSEQIEKNLRTIGFIIFGYAGVVLFSYGWLARKKEQ